MLRFNYVHYMTLHRNAFIMPECSFCLSFRYAGFSTKISPAYNKLLKNSPDAAGF